MGKENFGKEDGKSPQERHGQFSEAKFFAADRSLACRSETPHGCWTVFSCAQVKTESTKPLLEVCDRAPTP